MTITGSVLFVSDLTTVSDLGLQEAASLASGAGVELTVCHVVPDVVGTRPLFPQLRALDREQARKIRDWATRVLEQQLLRALDPGQAKPELRVESGSTHAVVLALAEELSVGLIVVGGVSVRHESDPAAVAEKIACQARCPVLLSTGNAGKAVLAATDFSDPALPAIRAAQWQATLRKLPLYVVHVVDLVVTMMAAPEYSFDAYASTVIAARREQACLLLGELSKKLGGVQVLLRDGPAVEAILGAAESLDAALVVVGTHGRTGLRRLALGSVAEGVIRRARRSTLVLPLRAERAPG